MSHLAVFRDDKKKTFFVADTADERPIGRHYKTAEEAAQWRVKLFLSYFPKSYQCFRWKDDTRVGIAAKKDAPRYGTPITREEYTRVEVQKWTAQALNDGETVGS